MHPRILSGEGIDVVTKMSFFSDGRVRGTNGFPEAILDRIAGPDDSYPI
jgi:hypothetical protein